MCVREEKNDFDYFDHEYSWYKTTIFFFFKTN